MIEPIPQGANRVPTAKGVCDECGRDEVFVFDYERRSAGVWEPKEGQAIKKLTAKGWAVVKGKLRCPACEAKRKAFKQEAPMAENVTELRQPTREQKRAIIDMLEEVYDTAAGRYKGTETDATVAAVLGEGVMPGWVAQLREDLFGPDGGNGEMEALLDEMKGWLAARTKDATNAKVHLQAAEGALRQIGDWEKEVAAFAKRVEAIQRAVGPKAQRA